MFVYISTLIIYIISFGNCLIPDVAPDERRRGPKIVRSSLNTRHESEFWLLPYVGDKSCKCPSPTRPQKRDKFLIHTASISRPFNVARCVVRGSARESKFIDYNAIFSCSMCSDINLNSLRLNDMSRPEDTNVINHMNLKLLSLYELVRIHFCTLRGSGDGRR